MVGLLHRQFCTSFGLAAGVVVRATIFRILDLTASCRWQRMGGIDISNLGLVTCLGMSQATRFDSSAGVPVLYHLSAF